MKRIKQKVASHPKLTGAIVGASIIAGAIAVPVAQAYAWNIRL